MNEPSRLQITYELGCASGEDPFERARGVALEQTVELPAGCFPADLHRRVVGRLEGMERLSERRWRAVISYDPALVGGEVPQLVNLLFGNVSLQRGVRVSEVEWPPELLELLPGPAFGVSGLRRLLPRTQGRPLLCTALKPLGLLPGELAELCYRFACGGVDIVKDDHGLADQADAPFAVRVEACREAVERARRDRGVDCLYFPHLTGPIERLAERAAWLRRQGLTGALVCPFVLGLDTLRWLAADSGLVLLAHPSFAGALFHPDHGVAADVVLGDLLRFLGADGVIFPNPGGRFPFDEPLCRRIGDRLRRPLRHLRPAFPVPAGGIDAERLSEWLPRYGPDTIFLLGTSLYASGDVEAAARRVRGALEGKDQRAAGPERQDVDGFEDEVARGRGQARSGPWGWREG